MTCVIENKHLRLLITFLNSGGGILIKNEKSYSSSVLADYKYCEDIIKKQSKSFYFAFSKLPEDKAQAVYAIYAFCRLADDSIDEAETKNEQAEALAFLTNELNRFENGKEPDHPVWRALRNVFSRYDMSIQPFYDQLAGQEMDYHFKQPQTLGELEAYSYFVAGSVGLMLLPIIATENKEDLTDAAISLGVAMQLTNVLRDVGEDHRKNQRIYLPEELMQEKGYTKKELENQIVNQAFVSMWETIAGRAEDLYDDFNHSLKFFDRDSQFPVALSAKVYGGILNAVRKNDYNCFTIKNKTSKVKKLYFYNEARKALLETD